MAWSFSRKNPQFAGQILFCPDGYAGRFQKIFEYCSGVN